MTLNKVNKKGTNIKNIAKESATKPVNKEQKVIVPKITFDVSYEHSILIIDSVRKQCSMELAEELVKSLRNQANSQILTYAKEQGVVVESGESIK